MRTPLLLIPLFIYFLILPSVHAIAIIGPAAYVITISLFAFIANTAIAATLFIAANLVLTKRSEKTALSTHVRFFLEMISKISVFVIAVYSATALVHPLTLPSALMTGLCAALIAISCAFLASYERLTIAPAEKRNRMLRSIVLYGIFVFIAGSAIGYYAIETTLVTVLP